jgi:hypothetical protein
VAEDIVPVRGGVLGISILMTAAVVSTTLACCRRDIAAERNHASGEYLSGTYGGIRCFGTQLKGSFR